MPSGYTYHQDEYKAPPAANPRAIGYDYSVQKNAEMLETWRTVASDLTDKIEAKAPLSAAPVFLSSPQKANAFDISLDHVMREEFRKRGYTLASVPSEDSIKLQISSHDLELKDEMKATQVDSEAAAEIEKINKDVIIKVNGLVGELPTTLVEAQYNLPLFGHGDKQSYIPLNAPAVRTAGM